MAIGLYILAALLMVAVVLGMIGAHLGARAVAQRVAAGGRQVVRVRTRWFRNMFSRGLTPLAFVYRVTAESEGRPSVRLYAYDVGQWLSRHNRAVRLFSGGVWRDA